jgi:hypothetical protein
MDETATREDARFVQLHCTFIRYGILESASSDETKNGEP